MTRRLSMRTVFLTALVLVIALVAAVLVIGNAKATTNNPWNGEICFAIGDVKNKISLYDPEVGYDINTSTLGFATLNGNGGTGVWVRTMILGKAADSVQIVLSRPAKRPVCAAFTLEQNDGP
jgi:hypothetical protein